jgi:uncharacterized delta-60 repeat protein
MSGTRTAARLLVTLAATLAAAAPSAAADGAIDPTFWGDGRYVGAAPPDETYVAGVLEAPDGALVWYGALRSTGQPTQYVGRWRRLSDGAESGCDLALPAGVRGVYAAGDFDASGRLVVAGWAWLADDTRRLLFARYVYPSCALDDDFAGDGVLMLDVGAPEGAYVADLEADGDAPTFVAQVQRSGVPDLDAIVGRLTPTGDPDPSFSGDGLVTFDGRAGEDRMFALELGPGGLIYVGGDGALPDGTGRDLYLLGLTSNGSPIPGFGLDGLVLVDFDAASVDPSDFFGDMDLLHDGRIVLVGGAATDASPGYGAAMAIVTPAGLLDPTFDGDGRLIDMARGEYRGVAVQGNGRIVLGALDFPSDEFLVSRRLSSGAADPTFAGGATVPIAFSEGGFHGLASVELHGGRVVAAGFLEINPGIDLAAIARLTNAYVFADGFEAGSTWTWSSATP